MSGPGAEETCESCCEKYKQIFVLRNTKGRALLAKGQLSSSVGMDENFLPPSQGFELGALQGKIRIRDPRDENGALLPNK